MKIRRSSVKSKIFKEGMRGEAHVQGKTRIINIKEVSDMTSRQTKASTNDKRRSAIIMERKDTTLEIAGTRKLKVTYLLLPITNNKKKKLGILRPLMQLKKLINKMSFSHVTLTKKRRLHLQL
ncbi:hypothetical protein KY285_007651 [Solanum tuberosum]|nr:hypothetical protein KY285_007651 [Solanum tuberosum]